MKNFHWGKAIALFFVIYIATLITVVIKSRGVDHSLVKDDYYAHDIAYQEHYDHMTNQLKYYPEITLDFSPSDQTVVVDFGRSDRPLSGSLQMYRAADKSVDQNNTFSIKDQSVISIPVDEVRDGKWTIQVQWTDTVRDYYYEDQVYMIRP